MTARDAAAARVAQDHPSPHRGNVPAPALWSGLLLAPLAWFVQMCIETPVLSQACYPRDGPLGGGLGGLSGFVPAVDLAALAACAASFAFAWHCWRRSAAEKPGRGGRLISSGDGRSRFMAMAGMLSSGLLATAVLYTGMLHVLLQECGL